MEITIEYTIENRNRGKNSKPAAHSFFLGYTKNAMIDKENVQ